MSDRPRRRRSRRRRNNDAPSRPAREYPTCPRCEKPIREVSSAIRDPETDKPLHFDCVLAELVEKETLAEGERISYLGNGSFGIINGQGKSNRDFRIKRRIQYEEVGEVEWRNEIVAKQPKPDIVLPRHRGDAVEEEDAGVTRAIDRGFLDLDEEP